MKILLVVHQYLPEHRAGTEVYTHSLARELATRHDVRVYCHDARLDGTDTRYREEVYEGIVVRRVAAALRDGRPSPLALFRHSYRNPLIEADCAGVLDAWRPDIVHVQHLKDLSAGILQQCADRAIPIVMTLHDYWAICPNGQFVRPTGSICLRTHARLECGLCAADRLGRPLLAVAAPAMMPLFWARDRYLRRNLAHVAHFVAPSEFLRGRYLSAGYLDERILQLENGLDLGRLSAARGPRGPYRGQYAYIGSLAWQKGVHVLVQAFRRLGDVGARLRIWGSPRAFPAYVEQLRRDSAGCPWISLEGEIDSERVGEALAWADYMIVPSLWWENSPVTIREAYAAGVPVIASALGALLEKVPQDVGGLLFEPASAESLCAILQRTHSDTQLLQRLRASLPPVQGIDAHARILEEVYERVRVER